MRAAPRGRVRWVVSMFALGACQDIIGISHYEIDPGLGDTMSAGGDEASAGDGFSAEGGSAGRGEATVAGGVPTGAGGEESSAGAGRPPRECYADLDCDDTIDCTDDICSDTGACEHRPDDGACISVPGECLTCRLGIGCVEAPAVERELLEDGDFDLDSSSWREHSDNYDHNIFVEAGAHSGTRIARFGPAPMNVEEYADLLQYVSIPEGTHHLTLTGYHRLSSGATKPALDYTVAALFARGASEPAAEFHSWSGDGDEQADWKAFSHSAPQVEVLALQGEQLTFDLVTHTIGTVYRFDSLSLTATICE